MGCLDCGDVSAKSRFISTSSPGRGTTPPAATIPGGDAKPSPVSRAEPPPPWLARSIERAGQVSDGTSFACGSQGHTERVNEGLELVVHAAHRIRRDLGPSHHLRGRSRCRTAMTASPRGRSNGRNVSWQDRCGLSIVRDTRMSGTRYRGRPRRSRRSPRSAIRAHPRRYLTHSHSRRGSAPSDAARPAIAILNMTSILIGINLFEVHVRYVDATYNRI